MDSGYLQNSECRIPIRISPFQEIQIQAPEIWWCEAIWSKSECLHSTTLFQPIKWIPNILLKWSMAFSTCVQDGGKERDMVHFVIAQFIRKDQTIALKNLKFAQYDSTLIFNTGI